MTRLPTDAAIGHLVDSLRALERRKAAGYPKRIDDIEHRLKTAVARDRTGSVLPDGYPTTTSGSGSSNNSTESSTERAACTLIDKPPRDRHHELTVLAVRSIEDAILGLNRAVAALNSIDDLVGQPTDDDEPRTCTHCTGKRGKGGNRRIYATGTVGDRLERSIALCRDCYGYVERSANAGTHKGHLPTDQQIQDHEARGRWRMKVA